LLSSSFAIAFGPFFSLLARDIWHNTDAEINLIWAVGSAASMVGILLGRMSDRWGARQVFALGALGFGISTAAWGLATSWQWGLAPLLIAFGFSEGAFIAYSTLQTEITTKETRTSVFGVITTTTGMISGLAPTFGAWLVSLGGYPLPFVAAGAMSLAAIGAMWPIRKRNGEVVPRVEVAVQAE
jgi:DHA1 family tetracycline resistance protein-like MFS transporter